MLIWHCYGRPNLQPVVPWTQTAWSKRMLHSACFRFRSGLSLHINYKYRVIFVNYQVNFYFVADEGFLILVGLFLMTYIIYRFYDVQKVSFV